MLASLWLRAFAVLAAANSAQGDPQTVLALPHEPQQVAPRLKGRFIHFTDLHPDPFYRTGASEDEACHFKAKRKKHKGHRGKKGKQGKKKHGGRKSQGGFDDEDAAGGTWAQDDVLENDDEDGEADAADKPRDAGYWGLPVSDCDSPLSLINSTFDWLEEHFKGEVDFVVWTGDNARHDIDTRLPRSLPEIFNLNRYVVDRVRKAFGNKVPVVASIGNNDIYPHNVMFAGPNKVTSEFLSIWKHLIPEHFLHTFARGGYYSIEAVPDDLLLISLNSLYFYSRNSVVDGCPPFDDDLARLSSSSLASFNTSLSPSSPSAVAAFESHLSSLRLAAGRDIDPGTEQLLWLEQQLVLARSRGMQVILTGHVPPTSANWYEGCYRRYAELVLGWQDTVVSQLFGHMNVDMFSFIQDADASLSSSSTRSPSLAPPTSHTSNNRLISPFSSSLVDSVHDLYSSLPSLAKLEERDYAPVHVNPSVIPTYLPGVRVWEYNTTRGAKDGSMLRARAEQDDNLEDAADEEGGGWIRRLLRRKGQKGKEKRPTRPPRHSSPHSPSRTNTFLSPLSYTQYVIPLSELERPASSAPGFDNDTRPEPPRWEIEYTTLSASEAARRILAASSSSTSSSPRSGAAHDPVFSSAHLPASLLAALPSLQAAAGSPALPARSYHTLRRLLKQHNLTPYDGVLSAAEGLTVRAWVRLARWVVGKDAGGERKKRWDEFRDRMSIGSGEL
ncbi:hypothetical protein Rhopal_005717-T1 [Rhodotorula paludigena]|uniref:Calcineurin-like phosphoesterase domain-containing protein n=1 Tax=Rhodotorula paludigena TaxID=86838 RepID=A0AAV5GTI5_9BASI|nr:hypothetical protein Rhopal_005717-T1 [Rhodotorula paludigena]